ISKEPGRRERAPAPGCRTFGYRPGYLIALPIGTARVPGKRAGEYTHVQSRESQTQLALQPCLLESACCCHSQTSPHLCASAQASLERVPPSNPSNVLCNLPGDHVASPRLHPDSDLPARTHLKNRVRLFDRLAHRERYCAD